jgi:CBS domain-containing protein
VNVEDVVTRRAGAAHEALASLGRFVRDEGVDLLDARCDELARGTPVYVHAAADVLAVQRRMAECHVRRVLVVRDDDVVGIVDLVDLALDDACASAPSAEVAPEVSPAAPLAAPHRLRPQPQPGS